jgi:hypothetical protein
MMRPTTGFLRTRGCMTNNASDTLSIHDLPDPREPVETAALKRKGDGRPAGDVLDVLKVMPDGTGQELGSPPVALPERDDLLARPQGGLFAEPATPCTASPTPPASCA